MRHEIFRPSYRRVHREPVWASQLQKYGINLGLIKVLVHCHPMGTVERGEMLAPLASFESNIKSTRFALCSSAAITSFSNMIILLLFIVLIYIIPGLGKVQLQV